MGCNFRDGGLPSGCCNCLRALINEVHVPVQKKKNNNDNQTKASPTNPFNADKKTQINQLLQKSSLIKWVSQELRRKAN